MQLRAIIISALGLCLAGASAWLASSMVPAGNQAPVSTANQPEFVKVLAAGTDIQYGDIISRELLISQSMPADNLPTGAFTGTRALLGPEGTSPRRATRAIQEGELIMMSNVSDFGEIVTILNSLSANTRAMSIEVDSATAVGGFVVRGDRVDIVLTEGRGQTLRAATILQDIRVLGVDQRSEKERAKNRGSRTITVEVTPRDGQILALAQRAGVLSLTLRTPDDMLNAELSQISLSDVLRDAEPVERAPEPVAAETAPKMVIRVRRGVEENLVELSQ